jgi:hypothetical protein
LRGLNAGLCRYMQKQGIFAVKESYYLIRYKPVFWIGEALDAMLQHVTEIFDETSCTRHNVYGYGPILNQTGASQKNVWNCFFEYLVLLDSLERTLSVRNATARLQAG